MWMREPDVFAFDINTGKELWKHNLGTIQKASLVLGDGKLYVGTENGHFFILKPGPAECQVLDKVELEPVDHVQIKTDSGDDLIASNEQVIASVGVSRGRDLSGLHQRDLCIGKRSPGPAAPLPKVTLGESTPECGRSLRASPACRLHHETRRFGEAQSTVVR